MMCDLAKIDVLAPIPPNGLMLVIMDTYPWTDPDSDDRNDQLARKVEMYANFVASPEFSKSHAGVDRSMVVISVVSVVPASRRMQELKAVEISTPPPSWLDRLLGRAAPVSCTIGVRFANSA